MRSHGLWSELKRRRVFRVAGVYAIAAFAVLQAGDLIFPALQIPDWGFTFLVLLALLGFPVALGLAWAFDVSAEGVEPEPPTRLKRVGRGAFLGVVLLVLAAGGFWASGQAVSGASPRALEDLPLLVAWIHPPQDHQLGLGAQFAAISPDGRRLVYEAVRPTGEAALWLQRLGEDTPRRLPGTDGGSGPFFAPHGRAIGFFGRGALWRMDLPDGRPVHLCNVAAAAGGSWGPRGEIVYATPRGELYRVAASGGPCRRIEAAGEEDYWWPGFLPEGRRLLLSGGNQRIVVLDLTTGEARSVGTGLRPTFVSAGFLLFYRESRVGAGGEVFAQRFDPDELGVSGTPVALTPTVRRVAAGPTYAAASAAPVLVYVPEVRPPEEDRWFVRTAWGDTVSVVEGGPYWTADIAHRHPWLVLGGFALRLHDWSNGSSTILHTGIPTFPVFSPDDRELVFSLESAASYIECPLYRLVIEDSETAPLALPDDMGERCLFPTDWSADGWILGTRPAADSVAWSEVWALSLQDTVLVPIARGDWNTWDGALSSDGRWLAYASDETGRAEVYVRARHGGRPVQVSRGGGRFPRWSSDGRALVFSSGAWIRRAELEMDEWIHVTELVDVLPLMTEEDVGLAMRMPYPLFAMDPSGEHIADQERRSVRSAALRLVQGWPRRAEGR